MLKLKHELREINYFDMMRVTGGSPYDSIAEVREEYKSEFTKSLKNIR
jgi:hypothetical protein